MPANRSRYVALLRGINVGKAKRVAMEDLRAIVAGLGFSDPKTLLNSGNVVFTGGAGAAAAKDAAARIEKAMAARLGVSARVTVLSEKELAAIVDENPLAARMTDPSRGFVSVLAAPADLKRVKSLLDEDFSPEAVAAGKRVVYMWCPKGLLESRAPEAFGKVLGDAVTTRNWATMTKLRALAAGAG
jgi:uncharacterized protein (DUF1697 family)